MTAIDFDWYWTTAAAVARFSVELTGHLGDLDDNLDVYNSAGHHTSAGTTWAMAYDQAASDIFELASLTAIAAGNLARLIHTAGANHAQAEDASVGGEPVVVPGAPEATGLTDAIHPRGFSAGGLDDPPGTWPIVEGEVTKKWADCDTAKIAQTGTHFASFVLSMDNCTIRTDDPIGAAPDSSAIIASISRVLRSLDDVKTMSAAMTTACADTSSWSSLERGQITALLTDAAIIIDVISTLPRTPGTIKAGLVEFVRRRAAKDVDRLLRELDVYVVGPETNAEQTKYPGGAIDAIGGGAMTNNPVDRQGVYATATSTAQTMLAPLLGRYARQTEPRRLPNGTVQDKTGIGKEGERRAGIEGEKQRITVIRPDGTRQTRYPDEVNPVDHQITEVKNKNSVTAEDTRQIHDSVTYGEGGNKDREKYSTVLVVDHRTQIPPTVQKLADEGRLDIVREELFDNLPYGGPNPKPFLPGENWMPPPTTDPQPQTGIPHP